MNNAPAKMPKYSRRAKILFSLGAALAAYTIVGFLVVPAVVKSQMLKRLPAMLKRPVAVEAVEVNPFALSVKIRGFAVNENNGAPFAGWDELYAHLNFSSFLQRGWSVREISLTHPFAHLARGRDGGLNFADILAALAASTSSAAPSPARGSKPALPLVMIDSLHVDNADITVEDLVPSVPVRTKLLPINVKLDNLSTAGGARNPYGVHATSDSGEDFQWSGIFTLDPPQVTGKFAVKNLDLKKYSPYLGNFVSASIADGRLDEFATYTVGLGTNGPELSLANGEMLLKSLSVKSTATGETVATVPLLSVSLAEANLSKKFVHLTSLSTSEGSLLVRQEKDGTINLLSMLSTTNAPVPATNPPAASQTPWTARVDDIAVERYAITVEDKKPAKPASLKLDDLSFKAKGFSFPGDAPIATDLSVRLNEVGKFMARGEIRLQPPSADLAIELTGLDLRPFQPYVEQQARLAIGAGVLNVRGHARYSSEKNSPLASFDGDVSLTNFATTDMNHFKDFVKLDALTVSGIKSAFQPNQVSVQEIKLSGLSASVMIDANRQINLLGVLPQKEVPTNAASPARPALDFPVSVENFVIDNASFHFTDQSIEPNCRFDLQQMDGTVKGLSSRPDSRAAVDLHGHLDDVSTFSVSGSANPLSKDLSLDVSIACQNLNLTPFTPYMEKFGGYPLERGKLLLDLHHSIAAGKLVASNHVIIAGLALGPKNSSPDAVHLPVKLGVALLKDRSGNIALDVPLSGSLNNPDFRVMPLVWEVFHNILLKAASSPFTLLGAVFGGGPEMSFIDFQPGLADISATEQAKLDKLGKVLYERPALQMEIAAEADPASDAPVLARLKLADQIRSLRAGELIAAGSPAETVLSVKVEPADYARLLKILYTQTLASNSLALPTPIDANLAFNPNPNPPSGVTQPSKPPPPPRAPAASPSASKVIILPSVEITASAPPPRPRPRIFVKGGELMVRLSSAGAAAYNAAKDTPPRTRPSRSAVAARSNTVKPTASTAVAEGGTPVPAEPTQDEMEATLLARIEITPDDLRELMQARARSIQGALVNSGKVEGERLFILAPRPVSMSSKGQARANLSLE